METNVFTRKKNKSGLPDSSGVGLQEVVNAADETSPLCGVGVTHLVDELHDDQLQNVPELRDLFDAALMK